VLRCASVVQWVATLASNPHSRRFDSNVKHNSISFCFIFFALHACCASRLALHTRGCHTRCRRRHTLLSLSAGRTQSCSRRTLASPAHAVVSVGGAHAVMQSAHAGVATHVGVAHAGVATHAVVAAHAASAARVVRAAHAGVATRCCAAHRGCTPGWRCARRRGCTPGWRGARCWRGTRSWCCTRC
jgi:hypothetical protein